MRNITLTLISDLKGVNKYLFKLVYGILELRKPFGSVPTYVLCEAFVHLPVLDWALDSALDNRTAADPFLRVGCNIPRAPC